MSYDKKLTIPLEYFGFVLETMSVIAVFSVAIHRCVQWMRKKGQPKLQIMVMIIALMGGLSEAPQIPNEFADESLKIILTRWVLVLTPWASLLYILFQIHVFDKFRTYSAYSSRWTIALIISVLLAFVGCETPFVVGYGPQVAEYNAFWDAWSQYDFVWYAFIGIVDVTLNLVLLRLFWTSKALTSSTQFGKIRTKHVLAGLCASVLLYDIFAVIMLQLLKMEVVDEASWRLVRSYNLIANSAIGFHGTIGLNYLSLLASAQSAQSPSSSKMKKQRFNLFGKLSNVVKGPAGAGASNVDSSSTRMSQFVSNPRNSMNEG